MGINYALFYGCPGPKQAMFVLYQGQILYMRKRFSHPWSRLWGYGDNMALYLRNRYKVTMQNVIGRGRSKMYDVPSMYPQIILTS